MYFGALAAVLCLYDVHTAHGTTIGPWLLYVAVTMKSI
jgi:hypothetical protein